ncbi:conserved membrane hypothetical protein [Candidatus Sulfotelmatomonas gaucii]|uniref:Zinc-ribbon domain-containing protein n=1 Tax=Candidatus Sulfuritelmatomonas gaucii TaxID=2043161 RepID=A0A2N9L920_9BACT|nr:conserved membrane hypothetical protein [Candidatus Sulfotelmatomonas gaucii]
MELSCSRCHQTVQPVDCFCPVCGLPQLVYSADPSAASGQPERWGEVVRDANTVDWKPALRPALALAIPAGVLCAALTRLGLFGLLLIPAAAAWVVALYVRGRRPAWITIGAGARIGLVTGILGGWTAALTTGITLYAMRFWLRQGKVFDDMWQDQINQGSQQLSTLGFDPQTIAATKLMMLSPEGRAASVLFNIGVLALVILVLAVAGGALGARLGRPRRSEN